MEKSSKITLGNLDELAKPSPKRPELEEVYQPIVEEMYAEKHRGQMFEYVRRAQIYFLRRFMQKHVNRILTRWQFMVTSGEDADAQLSVIAEFQDTYGTEELDGR